MISTTPLYIALTTTLFVWLSFRVISVRRSDRVSLGDGGSKVLERRIRAQGNCAEYAPLGLIIVLAVELTGTPDWIVHGLGLSLFAGRLLHGIALTRSTPWMLGRLVGMLLTFFALIAGAIVLLATTLF